MGVYLLRRLLLFLPTLLVVSVVIFFLSRLSPGDPIIQFIGDPFEEVGRGGVGLDRAELEYAAGAQRLGLDKPLFYLQLTGAAFPDTLYRILRMDHRKNLRNLIGQYGNWPQIEIYYKRLREASAICYSMEEQKKDWLINIRANIQQLFVNHQDVRISYLLNEIDTLRQEALTTDSTGLLPKSPLFSSLEEVKGTYARMLDGATPWKRYLPRLYWHGMNNQYHQWVPGYPTGRLGCFDERSPARPSKDRASGILDLAHQYPRFVDRFWGCYPPGYLDGPEGSSLLLRLGKSTFVFPLFLTEFLDRYFIDPFPDNAGIWGMVEHLSYCRALQLAGFRSLLVPLSGYRSSSYSSGLLCGLSITGFYSPAGKRRNAGEP
jgi:hypothetical protein